MPAPLVDVRRAAVAYVERELLADFVGFVEDAAADRITIDLLLSTRHVLTCFGKCWATMVQELKGAEAQALCCAEYNERSRVHSTPTLGTAIESGTGDTRVGSIRLAIPKLRQAAIS